MKKQYFDWMAALEAVQLEGSAHTLFDKLIPYIILWKALFDAKVHNPGSKSFVEPKVSPPFLDIHKRLVLTYSAYRSHPPSQTITTTVKDKSESIAAP